jgi:CRP/FNR family cyclic AMP-dependent transcriptional regulator
MIMAASTAPLGLPTQIEDILANLPISSTIEYGKGQMIYGPDKLSKSIYLVISGKVAISQIAENGSEVLLEIVQPDELFGESAFLDVSRRCEQSVAIERSKLMAWAISDIEELVMKRPRLAVALLQILAQRNAEFTRRIESLAIDSVERRLARSLIRFSERFGSTQPDGSIHMMPFTHDMLSRYVGTTREVITQYMNQFRKRGYLTYSRQGIHLFGDAIKVVFDKTGNLSAGTML